MNIATLPRRWTPVGLGGCVLWLDAMRAGSLYQDSARTTPVTANSDPVGGWSDLSGANNHATQSSATLRYTYSSTGLDTGYPGLVSDGVDDVLSTPSVTLPTATCFIVGKITTYKQYTGFLKLSATAGGTASNGVIGYYGNNTTAVIGNPPTSWYRFGTTSNIVNGNKVLFTQGWGSNFASIVVRKDRAAMTAANNVGTYAAPSGALPLHVGQGYSTTVSTATWGEVLAYSRQLAQSEIDAVEAYLRSKWGTP